MKLAFRKWVLTSVLGLVAVPTGASEALWLFIQELENATPFSPYSVEAAIGQKLEDGGEPDGPRGAAHWIARNVRISSDLVVTDLHLYFWDALEESPAEIVVSAPMFARNAECVRERDLLPQMGKSFSQLLALPNELDEALSGTAAWSAKRSLPEARIWVAKRSIGEMTVVVQQQNECVQEVIIATDLPW